MLRSAAAFIMARALFAAGGVMALPTGSTEQVSGSRMQNSAESLQCRDESTATCGSAEELGHDIFHIMM